MNRSVNNIIKFEHSAINIGDNVCSMYLNHDKTALVVDEDCDYYYFQELNKEQVEFLIKSLVILKEKIVDIPKTL